MRKRHKSAISFISFKTRFMGKGGAKSLEYLPSKYPRPPHLEIFFR